MGRLLTKGVHVLLVVANALGDHPLATGITPQALRCVMLTPFLISDVQLFSSLHVHATQENTTIVRTLHRRAQSIARTPHRRAQSIARTLHRRAQPIVTTLRLRTQPIVTMLRPRAQSIVTIGLVLEWTRINNSMFSSRTREHADNSIDSSPMLQFTCNVSLACSALTRA